MPRSSQDDELLLVPGASFDVRGYTRTAIGSHRDDLDLEGFAAQPLAPSTLRAIRSLERVERSTMHHLRNVLVTPTHKDARVTAFLITWAFEKFWMADALRAVLEAHAIEPLGESSRRGGGAIFDRIRPIGTSLFTGAIGSDIVAVHMALGIADDWAMGATYETVASDAASPTLDARLRPDRACPRPARGVLRGAGPRPTQPIPSLARPDPRPLPSGDGADQLVRARAPTTATRSARSCNADPSRPSRASALFPASPGPASAPGTEPETTSQDTMAFDITSTPPHRSRSIGATSPSRSSRTTRFPSTPCAASATCATSSTTRSATCGTCS